MENTSKALIIAGAALISILLISFALLIFNPGKGVSDSSKSVANGVEDTAQRKATSIEQDLQGI